MRFPPSFLAELKSRLPIDSIVGRSVNLKPKGAGEFLGLCPFHNEKTPSFTVSSQKGFYHCFGCGAHGDHVTFLMEHNGLSYLDAVKELANQAGMQLPEITPELERKIQHETTLMDIMQMAASYYQQQLNGPKGSAARDYVRSRGISAGALERFQIGYAPDERDGLRKYLNSNDISDKKLEACGLINQKAGGEPYDRFRGRLMFPIWDASGKVIAFGGRVLASDTNAPKYLNSPETELFHKGKTLYGFHLARQVARQTGEMVVAEGYMDVVALYQAGISYAVAPLGTALTQDQLKLLWHNVAEPTLCLDGDTAGKRAMKKAADMALPLLNPGNSLKFTLLPEGMDPDDMRKAHGDRALNQALNDTIPLSNALWQMTASSMPTHTPEQKAKFEAALMELADSVGHQSLKQYYRRFFRDKLWRENAPRAKKQKRDITAPALKAPIKASPMELAASRLLTILIKQPKLWLDGDVEDMLFSISWPNNALATISEILARLLSEHEAEGLNAAITQAGIEEDVDALMRAARVHDEEVADLTLAKRQLTLASLHLQMASLKEEYDQALKHSNSEEAFTQMMALQKELDHTAQTITKEREAIAMLVEG